MRVWPSFLLVLVLIAGQLIVGVPIALLAMASGTVDLKAALATPSLLLGTIAGVGLWNLLVVLAVCWLSPTPWRARLSLRGRPRVVETLLLALAAVGCGAVTVSIAQAIGAYDASALDLINKCVTSASPAQGVALALLIAVAGGIEELVFRGYLQTRFVARFGPAAGVTLAAALFGLIHLDLVQGTFAFCMGLVLGVLVYRTKSIASAIAAHMVNNAWAVLGARLFEQEKEAEQQLLASVAFGVAALLVGGGALLWRTRHPVAAEHTPEPRVIPKVRYVIVAAGAFCFCAAAAVVFAVAAVVVSMQTQAPLPEQEERLVESLGHAFGERAGATDQQCVDGALAHLDVCVAQHGERCGKQGAGFLKHCLERAAPTGLCQQVPRDIVGISQFGGAQCAARNRDTPACGAVMAGVLSACGTTEPR